MKTITLVIFFIISFKTFASEAFDARVNRLESRLNEVVKSFDERANVVVYAKERKQSKNLNLPSVPFVFKESKSVEEEPRFTSLEISVFSRIETLPRHYRNDVLAFTDGSASPNPGSCGAGSVIYTRGASC